MSKAYVFLGGLLVLAGVAITLRGPKVRALPDRSSHAEVKRSPELVPSSGETSSGTSLEVQRLRAELRQKDQLLHALAAMSVAAPDMAAAPVAAPPAPELDPAAKTADLLDERMYLAANDPAAAAEMERALRGVADSSVLGEAKLTSLYCGSTLCKVTLKAEKEATLNQSIMAMSSQLPKLFGASLAIRLGGGERALYLAKLGKDLAVNLAAEAPR